MKNDKIFSAAIKLWEPQDVIDWTTGFKYDFSKYKTRLIENKVNGHYLLYNLNKRFLSGTIGIVEDYEVNYFMSIVDKLRNLVFNNRYDTLQRYYLQATIISNNIKSLAGKIANNSDFKFRENSIKIIYKDLENLIKLFNDIIYWLSRCNPETASNESFQTIRTSTFFLCIELINVTGKVFKTYLEIVKEAVSPKTPAPNNFSQKSLPTPVDFNNNKELSAKPFLSYQNEPSYLLNPTTPIKIDENLFKDLIKSMDVIIKFCSVVVRSATQFDPDIFLTPFNYRRLTLKSLVPLSALSKSSDQLNATNMFDQQMPINQNIQNGNKKDENLTIITISGKNGKNYHTANGDNEIVTSAKLSDSHSLQNIGSPVESQNEHIGQNSWGFELKLENDWYTISKLVPQTPAAQSNRLDVGDQVLLIAHRLILGWEMEKVCKLLTEVDNDPYLILITRTHIKWATNSNPNNNYNANHNKYSAIYSANSLISPPLNVKIGSGDPRSPDSLWSPSASAMIKVKSPRPTTNTDLFQKKWYYENNSKFKLPSSFKSAGIQSLGINNSLNAEGKISNDNTITLKKYRQPTFSDMFRKSVSDSDKSHHGRSIRIKKNSKNDEQMSASPTKDSVKGATKSLSAHSIKSLFTKTFLPFFSHKKEKRSHFIFPHPFRKSKILDQNVPKSINYSSQTTNSSPTHEEETSSPTTDYNKILTSNNNNNVSSTNAKTDVSQSFDTTNKLLNDHKIRNSLSCGMSEILANEHDEGSPFKSCLSNASLSPNHNNCEENVFVSNRFLDYYLPYHHFPTVVASHNNNQSEEIKDEKTNKEENIKNDENFGKNANLKPENSNSIVKQINTVHSTDNTSIRVLTKDHEFQQALDLADTFANPNLERKRSSLDKSLPPSPTDSIDSGTPSTPVDFYQTWVLVKKIDIIENHHKISVVTLPKLNDENKAGQSPTTMHKNSLDSSQIINKSAKEDISISKDSTFLHSPKYPGQPINGRSDRSVSTFASAISNLMPSLKTGWSQCRSVIYFCSTNTNNSIFSQSPASTSSKQMQINETKVSGLPSDTTNPGGVMPSQSSCIDPELLQNLPYLYLQSPFWDKMENQMKFLTQTIYVPDFMVKPSIRMHNCIKLTSSYCIIYMALPSNSEFKRWLEKLKPVSHGYFEIMECDVNKDDVAGHDTLGANSSSAMKKSTSFLTKLEKLHNILK